MDSSSLDSTTIWDCVVVGGGAAGLSAALVLGRARRRTLVVDAGRQSNRPAPGIGGVLGHDHRPPGDFYAAGREEVAAYPSVAFHSGDVVAAAVQDSTPVEAAAGVEVDPAARFVVELDDGRRVVTRSMILAGGVDYIHPELPGAAERWGNAVFHCPFCHGWEVRDQPLGVLYNEAAVERARLLKLWSDDVTLYTDGPVDLAEDHQAELKTAGIAVESRPIAALRGTAPGLEAVVFSDGSERGCRGLLVPVRLRQRSDLATRLGASTTTTHLADDAVEVDPMFRTNVPGLFAVGDLNSVGMPSVPNSVAHGHAAATAVVHSLVFAP
jgi:thioredoxin reductase